MKIVIIGAVIVVTAGYFGSKLLLHHKVESGMDNAVLAGSPYVNFEYDGVSSTLSGELTVDGIRTTVTGFNDEILIDRHRSAGAGRFPTGTHCCRGCR